ncbi:MAG: flagellar biosynthetic protein FliR [Cellulosilyticum sp.]|nr:flagellar biosynthetic protein FliR [Cellulosilyticum sp.]
MEELYYLYEYIDVFLIIFARILATIMFLPIIEETKIPRIALAGISIGIAIATYFQTDVSLIYYEPTLLSYTILLIREIVVGLIIGFVVKIFFQIYPFVGSLLSMQGGISMSIVMDPTSGTQSTQIGRLYNLGLGAVFVISGGYHWLIHTLVESFELIPIGKGVFGSNLVSGMVETTALYLEIGLKLSMPIVAVILVVDFAMGILARTVPQMNMFVIGIPLKMIILFVLLIITINITSQFNEMIIKELVQTINHVIQGMRAL